LFFYNAINDNKLKKSSSYARYKTNIINKNPFRNSYNKIILRSKSKLDIYNYGNKNEILKLELNSMINELKKESNEVDEFNNKTYTFLLEVGEEVSKIENFQLDLLYDLNDIIYESKKIFKDFNINLFKAIEKGMSKFQYNLQEYIQNLIGDLLYNSQFIAESLNENEILRNAISEKDRNSIIIKLKDFTRIVNEITKYLYGRINDDYEANFSNDNPNSIKKTVINKVNQLSEKFEKESEDLINKIKRLIKYI
jgi:hypothetical protein